MVAEHGVEDTADFEGTPIPEDVASGAGDPGRLEAVIEQLKGQIQKLQQQLNMKTSATHDDSHKLKPIDVKDIEKPDTYDNNVSKFVTWYDRFHDLLEKDHPNWEYVFNAIDSAGRNKIMDTKEFCNLLNVGDTKIEGSIRDQSLFYMCQLKSYLRTNTGGELHARVLGRDRNQQHVKRDTRGYWRRPNCEAGEIRRVLWSPVRGHHER